MGRQYFINALLQLIDDEEPLPLTKSLLRVIVRDNRDLLATTWAVVGPVILPIILIGRGVHEHPG